jgi:H+/citrate symporter
MLLKLTLYELKYQLKNITLYVILAIALMFVASQLGDISVYPKKPEPSNQIQSDTIGLTPYGYKKINDPQKIMKTVYFEHLSRAADSGEVMKDFFMINKVEKLDAKQVRFIREAMKKIAPNGGNADNMSIAVSYNEFWDILNNLDRQLGGHTYFARQRLADSLQEPKTYEEALQDYNDLTVKDMYTRAVARMAADYCGIVFGIMPVFLAAFVFLRDKKSRAEELIFSRNMGSLSYVGAKFTGLCLALLLLVLVIALYFTYKAIGMRMNGFNVDIYAFLKTFSLWLVPTIMEVCALSMLVSLLFKGFIPAFIMGLICWAVSIAPLEGDYSMYKLFIRYNILSPLSNEISRAIAANRMFVTALAITIAAVTALVWGKRRLISGEDMG